METKLTTIEGLRFDKEHGVFGFEWTDEMKVWIKYDKTRKAVVITANRNGYRMLAQMFLSMSDLDINKDFFTWYLDAETEKAYGELQVGSIDTVLEVVINDSLINKIMK